VEDVEGKLVKMEGRLSGSQPMAVSWFHEEAELVSSERYDVSFQSNVAVLCIKSSRLEDSGRYRCHAANEAGATSCDIVMAISGGEQQPINSLLLCLSLFLSFFLCLFLSFFTLVSFFSLKKS